jgi:hypothetical protein
VPLMPGPQKFCISHSTFRCCAMFCAPTCWPKNKIIKSAKQKKTIRTFFLLKSPAHYHQQRMNVIGRDPILEHRKIEAFLSFKTPQKSRANMRCRINLAQRSSRRYFFLS